MTWYVTLGGHYGGPPPAPQIDDLSSYKVVIGESFTIYGSGFTPGTTVTLFPGDIVVGISSPTITNEIVVTLPSNLPNIKHLLTVSTDTGFNTVELQVARDVTFINPTNQAIDVIVAGLN